LRPVKLERPLSCTPSSASRSTPLANSMPHETSASASVVVSRWRDVAAGLSVAGLLLPEAVAYAGIAHLSVVHAFTALLAGLGLYALFGGSRFAIVAPTSSTAALVAAAAGSVVGGQTVTAALYLQAVVALVLVSGLMLIALAFARQGQLSSFISRPVLKGFAFALALTIAIRQLPDALGFELPQNGVADPLHILLYAIRQPDLWHLPSLLISVAAAVTMVALRRMPRVPASLLLIAGAIAAAHYFDWKSMGVREVGPVAPLALTLDIPQLTTSQWLRTAELAFGLVMLIFAESWGSMRTFALERGDRLQPNRELMVLGACNVGAAVLQGMPVGAGFSATSANAAAGAVSRFAGVVALAAIVAVWAFGLPALEALPRPVLAVAVMTALWHALSLKPLIVLWRMDRDRVSLVAAALAVFFLGVLDGMLAAVGISLLIALNRFSQPVVHVLGQLGTTRNFVDINTQQGAASVPGVLIVRPEEPLFFASAERVTVEIWRLVKAGPPLTSVILSLEESADLDSTAVDCLLELNQRLAASGKALYIARAKTTVRLLLAQWDPQGLGRAECMFWSVADAVESAQKARLPRG
jgi:SulP family sulfate permease